MVMEKIHESIYCWVLHKYIGYVETEREMWRIWIVMKKSKKDI